MSKELVCPFCQQELSYMDTIDGGFEIFSCDCKKGIWFFGNDKLWQELIRTRKALEIAKDKLDTVRQYHRGTAVIRPDDIAAYCDRAIEQITAIEQKESK